VSDLTKKIHQTIGITYGPNNLQMLYIYDPKTNKILKHHEETRSENDPVDMDISDSTESIPIIVDSTESNSISMDTDMEPNCEVIAKPEEAGGTYYMNIYIFIDTWSEQDVTKLYVII